MPSHVTLSFGEVDPRAARLLVDVIADVIIAMSALADVTYLRHRQSAC